MLGRTPSPIGTASIVAALFVWGASVGAPTNTVRADDCVTAPESPAPEGSHWYYRTDRVKQRQCWYLRAMDPPAPKPAAQATSDEAPATWRHHPNPVTDQKFKQDEAKCTKVGNMSPVGAGSPEFKFYLVFLECMRGEGYKPIKPVSQPPHLPQQNLKPNKQKISTKIFA